MTLAGGAMHGIHFTSPDPEIDWQQLVNGGITFAYVRATYGTSPVAELPDAWAAMRRAGLRRGAYHILRHDQDAIAQAATFLAAVRLERGDLPPALHVCGVEGKPAKPIVTAMREWLAAVDSELEARHGHPIRPILQLSDRVWRRLENPPGFSAYPLWVVDWKNHDTPRTPASWGKHQWTIHQYAGDARELPGVTMPTDLDRFNEIKLGDRGPSVARIKELLAGAGFPAGPGEGFDANTKLAVLRFQDARSLPADGIVGAHTFAELQWP